MLLDELLDVIYKIYEDETEILDNPPVRDDISFKEGDIIELNGNIYIYLWKQTDYGFLGLIATPYTLLTHSSHPRVKTDSPIYEIMAITDLQIPLKVDTIKKYLTDKLEVLPDKNILEEKIGKAIERKKVYHPIREKFLKNEAKRTAFLIEEFLED